jgi:HD superfamily phosphohydrolase
MPTYVRSLGVAKTLRILASTLLESNPEQFIGINNSYSTLDEVIKNKEEIKDLIYRGALLHDVGKTPLVDIISNCYRPLTDKSLI